MSDQYRQPSPYSTREQALAELRTIRRELAAIANRIERDLEQAAETDPPLNAKGGPH